MENLLTQLTNILIASKAYYSIHSGVDESGEYIRIYCQCSQQPIADFCRHLDLKILPYTASDKDAIIGIRPKNQAKAFA